MDLFGFPHPEIADVQMFGPMQATGGTTAWHTWRKPHGSSMLVIYCIGGGAGGGGGRGAAAGATHGGGGSGGGSGISQYLYPLWLLPDSLYILVGQGGTGGAGGSSANGGIGIDGQLSYVAVYPDTTLHNLLALSGAAAATAGGGGTAAAGGAAGVAGTVATEALAPLSHWAISDNFVAGVVGLVGGFTGVDGLSVTNGTGCPIGGSASGGGIGNGTTDRAGGGINALANTPFGAQAGPVGTDLAGSDGYWYAPYPYVYGACGGAAKGASTGGAGGNGSANAPGIGGGGGGAGTTIGGAGGAGGPGMIIMIAW
jgi:hypothetical protein